MFITLLAVVPISLNKSSSASEFEACLRSNTLGRLYFAKPQYGPSKLV